MLILMICVFIFIAGMFCYNKIENNSFVKFPTQLVRTIRDDGVFKVNKKDCKLISMKNPFKTNENTTKNTEKKKISIGWIILILGLLVMFIPRLYNLFKYLFIRKQKLEKVKQIYNESEDYFDQNENIINHYKERFNINNDQIKQLNYVPLSGRIQDDGINNRLLKTDGREKRLLSDGKGEK